jgi:hypothetical protein
MEDGISCHAVVLVALLLHSLGMFTPTGGAFSEDLTHFGMGRNKYARTLIDMHDIALHVQNFKRVNSYVPHMLHHFPMRAH